MSILEWEEIWKFCSQLFGGGFPYPPVHHAKGAMGALGHGAMNLPVVLIP